jgi:protease-4
MVALPADRIYANRFAMVGSLGAVMSKFDASQAIGKLGVTHETYASGPLKSMFSPWQSDTDTQRKAAQTLVDDAAAVFRADVEQHRRDRLNADATTLYSGAAWMADTALEMGLIDDIGVLEDVIAFEFPGAQRHNLVPHRTMKETLSMESLVEAVSAHLAARLTGEPTWQ